MALGDNRATQVLSTLERIENYLERLVNLAEASGIATSVQNTELRQNRETDLGSQGVDRRETRDERKASRKERREIKDTVEKKI